jgi:L-lactate dehydrogenase complex protein LldE
VASTAKRVVLFPTCVVDTVAPQVGEAVVRVLRRAGYEVEVPRDATCCGQPAWNAGFASESARVARTTLDALSETDGPICVPAGSCATMIRVFWPELFSVTGDEEGRALAERLGDRVREFSELLAVGGAGFAFLHGGAAPPQTPRRAERSDQDPERSEPSEQDPVSGPRVAYHHSCHMLRELGISEEPVALLAEAGAECVAWPGDTRCCGFGGLFSVKQPETSVAMADEKLDELAGTGAEMLVGCDTSCLMHLEGRLRKRGETLPVKHLAEVLEGVWGSSTADAVRSPRVDG